MDCAAFYQTRQMISPRFQNKLLDAVAALCGSVLLVGMMIGLEYVIPHSARFSWLLKAVPLAVAIPAVLLGYDAACQWYYRRFIAQANEKFFGGESFKGNVTNDWLKASGSLSKKRHLPTMARVVAPRRSATARVTSSTKRWVGQ